MLNAIQNDIQIQCNIYQNSKGVFFLRNRRHLKLCVQFHGAPKNQNNLENKKQVWRCLLSLISKHVAKLQKQKRAMLALRQKYKPIEQSR